MFELKRKLFKDFRIIVMKLNERRLILKLKHSVTKKIQLNIKNIWIGQIKSVCDIAYNSRKTSRQ